MRSCTRNQESNEPKPIKFVLVEGPPWTGKSMFAYEVCRQWDLLKSLKYFDIVLLLKLREEWVLTAKSLSDLFRYEYDPELSKKLSQELADVETQSKLLLVLDGFDEVSHSLYKDSIIKKILSMQLLPACTIILTTRPSAHPSRVVKTAITLDWLPGVKFLTHLEFLHIDLQNKGIPPQIRFDCLPEKYKLREVVLDVNLPCNEVHHVFSTPTHTLLISFQKLIIQSGQLPNPVLLNIFRETMAGIKQVLQQCPCLLSMELKRTRLGYDGILFICSALKINTSLKRLLIHDDRQLPQPQLSPRRHEFLRGSYTTTGVLIQTQRESSAA